MANAEQLYKAILRAALTTEARSANNQWAGRTSITTAAATATVSTTAVASDSLIIYTLQLATAQASGTRIGLRTKTIADGSYFTIATDDDVALVTNGTIHWFIMPTN